MPQLDHSVIKERAAILRARGDTAFQNHLEALVGQTVEVLVERNSTGHSAQFAPVRIEFPDTSPEREGEIVSVDVTGHDGRFAIANPLTLQAAAPVTGLRGAA
jgi:threonylcarbamoyladenosine tRNA methylthiotransferase MtaB